MPPFLGTVHVVCYKLGYLENFCFNISPVPFASKIEKVPIEISGEKSTKDMASSGKLVVDNLSISKSQKGQNQVSGKHNLQA